MVAHFYILHSYSVLNSTCSIPVVCIFNQVENIVDPGQMDSSEVGVKRYINSLMHRDSYCSDSAIVIVFSTIDNYR